jgi:hypothetical protein
LWGGWENENKWMQSLFKNRKEGDVVAKTLVHDQTFGLEKMHHW